jgi:hypothetical protein
MGVEGGERCSGVAVLDGETSHRKKTKKMEFGWGSSLTIWDWDGCFL